jgi:hypothetical protein
MRAEGDFPGPAKSTIKPSAARKKTGSLLDLYGLRHLSIDFYDRSRNAEEVHTYGDTYMCHSFKRRKHLNDEPFECYLQALPPFYKYVYKARRASNLQISFSLFSIYRNSKLKLNIQKEPRSEVCMLSLYIRVQRLYLSTKALAVFFLSLSLKSFHVMYFMIE